MVSSWNPKYTCFHFFRAQTWQDHTLGITLTFWHKRSYTSKGEREYEDLSMQETIELRDPLVKRRLYKSSPEYRKKKKDF